MKSFFEKLDPDFTVTIVGCFFIFLTVIVGMQREAELKATHGYVECGGSGISLCNGPGCRNDPTPIQRVVEHCYGDGCKIATTVCAPLLAPPAPTIVKCDTSAPLAPLVPSASQSGAEK